MTAKVENVVFSVFFGQFGCNSDLLMKQRDSYNTVYWKHITHSLIKNKVNCGNCIYFVGDDNKTISSYIDHTPNKLFRVKINVTFCVAHNVDSFSYEVVCGSEVSNCSILYISY